MSGGCGIIVSLDTARSEIFDQLEDELRLAPTLVPAVFGKVLSGACRRAGAWNDAALVLLELELPAWSLRRLIREDGDWLCSLSRQPNLPAAFDITADAHHDSLPLASLLAFLQAQPTAEIPPVAVSASTHMLPGPHSFICCDNFA
jgi:hypothetical protein